MAQPSRPPEPAPSTAFAAVAALAVGAALGMAGGALPRGPMQDVAWTVSGVGYAVGAGLGALVLGRRGLGVAAVGLALFALAEGVVMSGANRATDPGAGSAFASGAAFYAGALLVAGSASGFPGWSRAAAFLSAAAFGTHSLLRALGEDMPVGAGPYAVVGYLLLTVAMVGWATTILRSGSGSPGPSPAAPTAGAR